MTMELDDLIISDTDYIRLSKLQNIDLLEHELSRAYVVPADQLPSNVVSMNTHVIYLDERSGISRAIELVYPEDANWESRKVSVLSPVGSALLGLREGQTIRWPFPNNHSRNLKVLSVTKPNQGVNNA